MVIQLIDWFEAQFNPIMVKEIYQGFRGRGFVIGYSLALLISLGGYMTIVLSAPPDNDALGARLFSLLFFSMMLVALLVIPVSAGNQLRHEITSNTLELIAITNLSPWAIISGRFQAAGLKLLLLFACMGPFAIAAFLLGGIGVTLILFALVLLLLFSQGFCAVLLMVNALPALNRRYKRLATTAQTLLVLLIVVQFFSISFDPSIPFSASSSPWTATEVWLSLYLLCIILLLIVFFLRMAADLLTPRAKRTYVSAGSVLMVLLMFLCLPFLGKTITISVVTLLTLYFFALFWEGQQGTLHSSSRHFFKNGYVQTLVYVIILTISMSFLATATTSNSEYSERFVLMGLYCVSYYTFFSGLARMLRRFLKPEKRTVLIYIILLLAWISFNGIATFTYSSVVVGRITVHNTSSVMLAFMPLASFGSLPLFRHVGLWMLLPFIVGLFTAWLGKEKTTVFC